MRTPRSRLAQGCGPTGAGCEDPCAGLLGAALGDALTGLGAGALLVLGCGDGVAADVQAAASAATEASAATVTARPVARNDGVIAVASRAAA
ncbi:MAG TPA: hypothetical protein VF162_16040 [Streptosporangiaceae bacterium]